MLSEDIKKLENEIEQLKSQNALLKLDADLAKSLAEGYKECCLMIIPQQVYTCKKRRNTTVKFKDGSQITVKRKYREKDCIETAIAYCIMKQLLPAEQLKELIKNREEH